jgi:hypothetical protein
VRSAVVPLNPPKGQVSPDVAAAAKEASIDAFHLAAIVSAGLLLAGAAANGIGLRESRSARRREAEAGGGVTGARQETDRAASQPGP